MKLKQTLFLSVLFLTSVVRAENIVPESLCGATDIRDQNPALKEFFSVPRNQRGYGYCYAFVAADLISVEAGTPVSSAHVAAIYNKNISENIFFKALRNIDRKIQKNSLLYEYEGGFITSAVNEVSKAGTVCTESNMSYFKTYGFLNFLEEYKTQAKGSQDKETLIKELGDFLTRWGFEKSTGKDIYERLKKENFNRTYEHILRENCAELVSIDIPRIFKASKPSPNNEEDFTYTKLNYFNLINHALEKGKPVGISYDVRYIMDDKGLHGSTLTGRRFKNGKCEYKVRNSWGQKCSSYKTGIDCIESEGSFWVSDETLFNMHNNINYIE